MPNQKFFITTPIYYINDRPHIGHAYTTIAADVLSRYHREQGHEVLFTTGTDENGQKTVEAAEAAGQQPRDYADVMAAVWLDTWNKLGISFNQFIRTTDPAHVEAATAFINKTIEAGDIYKDKYEGLYCVSCEEFKTERETKDGKCVLHPNRKLEQRSEENYFFKLSKYQKQLEDYIQKNPDFVQPASRRNEVLAFIKGGLHDFPVSRADAKWGIDWPGDSSQKVYVWFDALTNYLTVTGYPDKKSSEWWPPTVHLVGKDIIKFHCVYWPAMLLSAGLPLPQAVFAHGFFTIDGKKISKSLGNAIDPVQMAGDYGIDALRYYLLREIPFGQDGEFNHERFAAVYESDLANELGNAVQRIASMITKYLGGTIGEIPVASHDTGAVRQAMDQYRLDKALTEIWVQVKGINQYIEEEKPWELEKKDPEHLAEVLRQAVADLLQVAQLLLPFMPATAKRIVQTFADGQVHLDTGILFPKFDTKK